MALNSRPKEQAHERLAAFSGNLIRQFCDGKGVLRITLMSGHRPALGDREVTLEGDEVYTRVSENRLPPLAPKDGRSTLSNAAVATGS
jgi:hypothetical protein